MDEPRRNSPARRVLKLFALGVLALVVVFGALFAWVATRPDAPAFDDSAMLPQRPHVPAGQNGYDALFKALGDGENLPEDYYQDLREIRYSKAPNLSAVPDKTIDSLKKKYDARYMRMRQALELPHFVAPPQSLDRIPNYLAMRYMSEYTLVLAWQEAHAGRAHEALGHAGFVLKSGNALETSHGHFISLMIGVAARNRAMEEINAMLRGGILPDEVLPEAQRIFEMYAPDQQNWEKAAKAEYEYVKHKVFHAQEALVFEDLDFAVIEWLQGRFLWKPARVLQAMYPYYVDMAGIAREPYRDSSQTALLKRLQNTCSRPNSLLNQVRAFWGSSELTGSFFACVAMPNFERAAHRVVVSRVQWRLMQVQLAAYRFRSDHGAPPPDLAALVPEYLSAIPADPMDGEPLRYDAKKQIAYSVGFDLKDDGGQAGVFVLENKEEKMDWDEIKEKKDLVLRIVELKNKPPGNE